MSGERETFVIDLPEPKAQARGARAAGRGNCWRRSVLKSGKSYLWVEG
jgi:hypothetical protein